MKGSKPTLRRGGGAHGCSRQSRGRLGTRAWALASLAAAAVGWVALAGGQRAEPAAPLCSVRLEERGAVVEVSRVRPPEAAAAGATTLKPHLARSSSEAFRDPATGRLVEPAPGHLLESGPQRLSAALSTSAEGLVEEPVTASPGGVRVSLRGRFRSATFAERRGDGALAVECGEPAAIAAVEAGEAPPPPAPPAASGGAR